MVQVLQRQEAQGFGRPVLWGWGTQRRAPARRSWNLGPRQAARVPTLSDFVPLTLRQSNGPRHFNQSSHFRHDQIWAAAITSYEHSRKINNCLLFNRLQFCSHELSHSSGGC